MKPTIEALWNGNIAPFENCGVRDPEIERLVVLIEQHKQTLDKSLDQQQKDALEKYLDCYDRYSNLITVKAFTDGFCLAGKLLAEALLQ